MNWLHATVWYRQGLPHTQLISLLKKAGNLLLMGLLFQSVATAQLTVTADKSTARYEAGEQMNFTVTSSSSGTVNYVIKYDNDSPEIESGNINVSANSPTNISFALNEPGTVFCSVTKGGSSDIAGAVFSPFDIQPLEAEPSNLDAFWNTRKAELAAIPIDPQLTFHESHQYGTTHRLELSNIDGRKVYGYISIPTGSGPFPAIVSLPPAGAGANLVQPRYDIAERAGAISVTLSIHNTPPDVSDPNGYEPNDIADPNGIYYKYALLGAIRTLDYLFTRSDFDGENLGVAGVSQGGGLAMILAGLDQRVKLLAVSNPSHGQHAGLKYDQASPYPFYVRSSRALFGTPQHEAATVTATKYYDAMYFAKRYNGPAFIVTCYEDDVVPSSTVFAGINQLRGTKVVLHAKDLGHTHPPEYWNGRFDFFRKHFPSTLNAPWPWTPTTTGYFADAGTDISSSGSSTTLNGSIQVDGAENNSFPVEWKVVQGPGSVNFSNANAKNTDASFSASGTYVLSFTAFDDNSLVGEAKFYSLTDYVTVTVGGSNNTPPSVTLSTPSNTVAGPFNVSVSFSESVNGLSDSDFSVTNGTASGLSGSGQDYSITISPTNAGNVSIGLPSDRVTDAAGDGNTLSNTLNVNFDPVPPSTQLTLTCPDDIAVTAAPGAFSAMASWADPTATTTCANNDIALTQTAGDVSGSVFPIGTSTITYQATDNCSNVQTCSFSIIIESGGTGSNYCDAQGNEPWQEWIERVQFNTIDNTSFKELYGDFTVFSTDVAKGNLYVITLTPSFSWLSYNEHWRVWIDFNRDFNFDTGEIVYSNNGTGALTGFIQIPTFASNGPTRMRIAMQRDDYPDACGSFSFGEVEDYTLNIMDGGSSGGDVTPPDVTLSSANNTVNGPFTVNVNFTENVSSLDEGDFMISNGWPSNLTGSGSNYFITVNPISEGYVGVFLPPNGAQDAAGNGNTGSNVLGSNYTLSQLCPDMDLLPESWSDFANGGFYSYTVSTGIGTFISGGDALTGKEILFSDIGFTPDPDFDYDLAVNVLTHSAGDHTIGIYLSNSSSNSNIANLKNIVGTGEQTYSLDLNSFDRIRLAGQGGGSNMNGTVILSTLEIRCTSSQPVTNDPASPLEFKAERNGRHVLLEWFANNNSLAGAYTIERSADGNVFSEILTVPNTSNDNLEFYWEVDWQPTFGDNYYRLKQILIDGSEIYSDPQKINFDIDLNRISLFPNPANNFIEVNLHPFAGKPGTIQIVNQLGQQMEFIEFEYIPELTSIIRLENFNGGYYFLNIEIDGQKGVTLPFVVVK